MARRAPSYRLHRATGKALVTVNSRDYYLGPHGTRASKQAYSRLIAEWEATGRSTSFGLTVESVTLAMVAADYLDHCEAYYPSKYNSEIRFMSKSMTTAMHRSGLSRNRTTIDPTQKATT